MERFINQKVESKRDGTGIIKSVRESSPGYIIEVQYENANRKLGLDTVIKNRIINFSDKNLQLQAEELIADHEKKLKEAKEKERLERERQRDEVKRNTTKYISPSATVHPGPITELNSGVVYGTRAQSVYEECSRVFGWNWNSRGMFGRQQKLYANRVAGRYSVWFIAHSNYTGDRSNRWGNYIKGETIEEEYEYKDYDRDLNDVRIVFYKNERAYYVFAGIYEQESQYTNERGKTVMIYRRISEKYPE